MKAIVSAPICGLYSRPERESTLVDEVLHGMVVEVLEEVIPGWLKVRTHYRYEGIACDEDLLLDDEAVESWEQQEKKVVLNRNFCDVLSEPKVQGWILETLPLGALVAPLEEAKDGWQKVLLPDGSIGFVMENILGEYHPEPAVPQEEALRDALAEAALRYRGTHYRWGGKSPMGIDCSGLCSMAYLLCGILIFRDADIREGFPIREIRVEEAKKGDLLFFPGHVAMYLGEGRYVHSSGKSGGVALNSLIPGAEDYREELHKDLLRAGTYF